MIIYCYSRAGWTHLPIHANPADDKFSYFNDAAYKSGVKAPNSGHVRVTVGTVETTVEYFLAARDQDGEGNLQLAHSYSVAAKN